MQRSAWTLWCLLLLRAENAGEWGMKELIQLQAHLCTFFTQWDSITVAIYRSSEITHRRQPILRLYLFLLIKRGVDIDMWVLLGGLLRLLTLLVCVLCLQTVVRKGSVWSPQRGRCTRCRDIWSALTWAWAVQPGAVGLRRRTSLPWLEHRTRLTSRCARSCLLHLLWLLDTFHVYLSKFSDTFKLFSRH